MLMPLHGKSLIASKVGNYSLQVPGNLGSISKNHSPVSLYEGAGNNFPLLENDSPLSDQKFPAC